MKKIIFTASLIFSLLKLNAQNIDNPSFDSIYIGGLDRIFSWITSDSWMASSGDTILPLTPLTHYTTTGLNFHEAVRSVLVEYNNSYDGPFAVKILSDSDRIHLDGSGFRGFVVNGDHFYTDSIGYIDLKKGGTPFPYRPYSLKGHYKYEEHSPSLSNYPQAVVLLKKYNSVTQTSDTIGYSIISMSLFATSTWRAFEMPINYISNQIPDSIVVAFLSSGLRYPSTLWIDSLGFDFSTPTIINEDDILSNSISIFPNPAKETITISFDKTSVTKAKISIADLSGKIIYFRESAIINNEMKIFIPDIESGIYLINIFLDNKICKKKISIIR